MRYDLNEIIKLKGLGDEKIKINILLSKKSTSEKKWKRFFNLF